MGAKWKELKAGQFVNVRVPLPEGKHYFLVMKFLRRNPFPGRPAVNVFHCRDLNRTVQLADPDVERDVEIVV